MSYIEDTISKHESITYVVKFHWIYTFIAFLYLIFLGVFIVGVFMFLKMIINKWTTERALTNTRYIQKTGWIARNTEEISINKIEEVDLKQSILGRILDYGSISISGTGSGNILLKSIDSPLTFQKHLNNLRFKN
ncbi:PH domain-containing protein [Alphaproteobacteria bacterium]|nr:PH domain-containing protein [Alphaproteobacteria bacterium]